MDIVIREAIKDDLAGVLAAVCTAGYGQRQGRRHGVSFVVEPH